MVARLLVLAVLLVSTDAHGRDRVEPGTYDLRICGASCAHGSTLLHGTLVLLAAPVRDVAGAPLVVGIPEPVNGCFRFDRYRPHGMIGHEQGGYLIWSRRQGRVLLNFSPDGVDAGYAIDFPDVSDALKGRGVTWYASEPNPPPPPPDVVTARCTGAADPALCAPSMVEPLRGAQRVGSVKDANLR